MRWDEQQDPLTHQRASSHSGKDNTEVGASSHAATEKLRETAATGCELGLYVEQSEKQQLSSACTD
jgi:hypothetical protein